jgi:hypothetical protein
MRKQEEVCVGMQEEFVIRVQVANAGRGSSEGRRGEGCGEEARKEDRFFFSSSSDTSKSCSSGSRNAGEVGREKDC